MPRDFSSSLRTVSIRAKLFLLIGGLLVIVTVFYSWAAYREMRESAEVAVAARLEGSATQWASTFATSRQTQLGTLRRLRDSAAVRDFLLHPDTAAQPERLTALRALFRIDSTRPTVQLIDTAGRELLHLGTAGTWSNALENATLLRAAGARDSGAAGSFRVAGDSLFFANAVRVIASAKHVGYLVEWRRMRSTTAARDQLNRLFGVGTRVLLANRAGDVWTDLSQRIPSPNVDLSSDGLLHYQHSSAEPVVAIAKSVAGTPWAIVIESSSAAAFAQTREFLERAWLVGLLTLIVGLLGTLALSVSLTRPLARLTRSAEAVATGDYTQQSGLAKRNDELGRLAGAFDTMVSRVQDAFAARHTSEERYRRLFDAVPLPQWVFDRETLQLLAVNEAAMKHYGYSREEFLAMTIADLRPADDVPYLRQAINNIDDPRFQGGTWRHLKKDGTIIEVETSGHSLDIDGRPTRIAIMHDVTARNRAAEALRQSEEKYRRLLSEAPIGMTLTSNDGRFLVVNGAFATMVGYSSVDEIFALSISDLYANKEQQAALQTRFRESGRINREQIQLLRRDGSLITTRFTGRLVTDVALGESRVEAVWEDVTEQLRMERQFHQSQKMEAVGLLAGGVAHDFNNLLTIIISSSDMLRAELPADSAHFPDVEAIRNAGKSAAALTRQLLAFSRRQVLQPRVMQLNELVTNTAHLLERLLSAHIELVTSLYRDAGSVKVDPGQMEQVVVNLAVNAQDAMPNGGRLLIESKNVTFTEPVNQNNASLPAGRYVTLTVSDTGGGMDTETQARVFEPFFTTKQPGQGTGLGLATVYGIVRQSGGFISVYSERGAGTTFKIYFPRVDDAVGERSDRVLKFTPLTGTETVLVVEDAAPVRAIIQQVLRRHGYNVLEAVDGENALQIGADHDGPIHLLLTDVVMPRMGGRALAEHFGRLRPDTRVLFVSGYTDDAIVQHGVLEPGVNYLEKPFTPDDLARKVRHLLDTAATNGA
ncbi:MAG: PAS domain S-box protein [Gemmatimonadaceae bacterium]